MESLPYNERASPLLQTTPPGSPPQQPSPPPAPPESPTTDPLVLPPRLENEIAVPVERGIVRREPKGKGKADGRRHQKGDGKQVPGPNSWVWGTKLEFFSKRKDQYLRAAEQKGGGPSGLFYTKIARLYEIKYGLDLKDDEDLEFDIDDPLDEDANKVVHRKETPEDAGRKKAFQTLRTRIGNWYRAKYGGLLKSDKAAFQELFVGVLDGAPPKPQRAHAEHFYSRKFYQERVKEHYDERMAALERRAEYTGEKVPLPVAVRMSVTRECLAQETPAFREEMMLALEREYEQALKGWKASLADSPSKTPEEMAASLENAAHFLQPLVDAVNQRFGMCASLFLCGPIGKHGGAIGVRSVHAGETRGLVPQKWPEWDKSRFQEVETRMVEWTRECYSEAECRARAVAVTSSGDTSAVASGSLAGTPLPTTNPGLSALPAIRAVTPGSGTPAPSRSEIPIPPLSADNDDTFPENLMASHGAEGVDTTANGGEALSRVRAGGNDSGGGASGDNGIGGCGIVGTNMLVLDETNKERGNEEDRENNEEREKIEEAWQRDDRADWTPELARAHAAFARGKDWGISWAECVGRFFDFEAAYGYDDDGPQMKTADRPKEVRGWLARARNWDRRVDIGVLGDEEQTGSFVWTWWKYWRSLQPADRPFLAGMMTYPDDADWETMSKLHGRNGLLQVMLTLFWWGEAVGGSKEGNAYVEWKGAVQEVGWVLQKLLDAIGVETGSKRKRKDDGEDRRGKSKRASKGKSTAETNEGRQTRASAREKGKEVDRPRRGQPKKGKK
ncbi:hypothetical protein B0H15DRAFT_957802 [Mycena belliarum]|uniref:Uncharacterized protein n=1 Tax=Mycena belliarum TaxID=1033014 RepID=A0AAD6TRG2_9AGAR|nr:hypothetical protein B0H15DRAFT_957802 [Mycena belliae]